MKLGWECQSEKGPEKRLQVEIKQTRDTAKAGVTQQVYDHS